MIEQQLLDTFEQDEYEVPTSERGGTYYSDVACSVINSIYNDKREYHVLITNNNRSISDLPEDSAIEITCRVTQFGVVPVYIGTLPPQIRGLIQQMKAYEEVVVDAIIERDLEKALYALQINPLTTSIQQAKLAFTELVDAHREYLDYYFEV